jgi:hypothetical protein
MSGIQWRRVTGNEKPKHLHDDDHVAVALHTGAMCDGRAGDVPWQEVSTYHVMFPAGIGDVTSTAPGSGARYNAGKPRLDLIPAGIVAGWLGAVRRNRGLRVFDPRDVLEDLHAFQIGDDRTAARVFAVLAALGIREEVIPECANVFEYGLKKYAAWNWAKGMPWSVPVGCAMRHLVAWHAGEENDPESGLPHRGHVACNLVMLAWYIVHWPEGNDLMVPHARSTSL